MTCTEFGRGLRLRSKQEIAAVLKQQLPAEIADQLVQVREPIASRKRPRTTITGEELHDAIATSIASGESKEKRVTPALEVITSRQLSNLETETDRVEPQRKIRVRPDLTAMERNNRISVDYKLAWEAPASAPLPAAMQVAIGWSARWGADRSPFSGQGEIWYIHPESGEVTVVRVPHLQGLIQSIPLLHNLVKPNQNGNPSSCN